MSLLLQGDEELERELVAEKIGAPATGSVLFHIALAGSILAYYFVGGFFKSNTWGGSTSGGAIRVNVTNTIPLPSEQPPNENVLATEKPSPAPAPPQPKAAPRVDDDAIAIQGKQAKKQPPAVKAPKIPQPVQTNKAQYGEQAANNMPRSTTGTTTNGPVSVTTGDFGSRFPWYVEIIKRKVDQNWFRAEVDPKTTKGSTVQVYFRIDRSGVPSQFKVNKTSGSPTLDRSCLRAAQRVDTFGPLPAGSNDRWLDTTYDCTY